MVEQVENCFGCCACAIVCPKNAIEIARDADGFLKPTVNSDFCVECGLCLNVCPTMQAHTDRLHGDPCMIARSIRASSKSSSGGIGGAIAERAIAKELPVCGVTYDRKCQEAVHVMIHQKEQLDDIVGSKYLQSFSQRGIEEILSKGKGVVFGTPCQMAGLDNLLRAKGKRDNFLLVDIFCHGVPSQNLWKNHLKYICKKYGVEAESDVSFRSKKKFVLTVGTYQKHAQVDPFYRFYLNRYVYNDACYECPFRRASSADIRLGDYFGSQAESWSVCFPMTEQGEQWIQGLVEDGIIQTDAIPFLEMDSVQDQEGAAPIPENRQVWLKQLRQGKSPAEIMGYRVYLQYLKGFIKKLLHKM